MKLTGQQKRVKKVLKEIVAIMTPDGRREDHDDYIAARQMWYILSALRGPDSEDNYLKAITTEEIRAAIGITARNHAGMLVSPGSNSLPSTVEKAIMQTQEQFRPPDTVSRHFASHYKLAVNALVKLGYLDEVEDVD